MVELLFLPSVYAPCPTCHGTRYNEKTLEIRYRGKTIAEVLGLTVEAACDFFADAPAIAPRRSTCCARSGSDYLRLGQPATELSGGEAQRIKLATELQRAQRGGALYVLDEPTTGLHPSDVERLVAQLARAGRRRQHRDRGRARHARRRRERLGDRHRPGRRRGRRAHRGQRRSADGGSGCGQPHRSLPAAPAGGRMMKETAPAATVGWSFSGRSRACGHAGMEWRPSP